MSSQMPSFPAYDPNRTDQPGTSDEGMSAAGFSGPGHPRCGPIHPFPRLFNEIPWPASVLHGQMQALAAQSREHRDLKKRQAQNRDHIKDLRAAIVAFQGEPEEQSFTARLTGLPDRAARLDQASARLAEALAEQPSIVEEVRAGELKLKAARAKMRDIAVAELRSLASRADAKFQEAEQLSNEADAIEAEAQSLQLELPSEYAGVDDCVWGGWSYTRGDRVIDGLSGHRFQGAGLSPYRLERQRKRRVGVLTEVAS